MYVSMQIREIKRIFKQDRKMLIKILMEKIAMEILWNDNLSLFLHRQITKRDVAQPGSVLAWGARGRWFKSSHPDFFWL